VKFHQTFALCRHSVDCRSKHSYKTNCHRNTIWQANSHRNSRSTEPAYEPQAPPLTQVARTARSQQCLTTRTAHPLLKLHRQALSCRSMIQTISSRHYRPVASMSKSHSFTKKSFQLRSLRTFIPSTESLTTLPRCHFAPPLLT